MKKSELARIVDDVIGKYQFISPIVVEDTLELYDLLRSKLSDYLLDISQRDDEIYLKVYDNYNIVLRRVIKPQ